MNKLNEQIKQWLIKHNIHTLSPDKQYLKIIEEVGELARGLLKNDLEAIKDAIGDIYVAVVGYSLQTDKDMNIVGRDLLTDETQELIMLILYWLGEDVDLNDRTLISIIKAINEIAINNNLTLKECVEHAYNEIKDRDIKIIKGVAVK